MPTTDNRIVQMTFKNEQFERGVRESLHSLEELKKALDLDKSAESLSNLEKIAGSFDISGIAKGIDDIASRFTLLGNVGQEIFHRISRVAVDTMQNVVHTITSMPQAGLSKYEQKNKSIQMIQSAMPDKTIEEIEAVLAKLNEYTDLTSYDFSTMANSIGKFVSAGVDLEVAEKVMEGIANETASAGGEISQANIAMYNFSQALAAGSVKLMDWRSIQNQNLDTKEFKEQIIETAYELGTLQKVGEKVGQTAKGTLVDFQSLPQTLNEDWFTSEVMIKVFEKYADRLDGVGKKGFEAAKVAITLTQAFDAVKDAISTGWMTSFGYIFGNLEEASDLFTRVSDALIGFAEQIYNTRNELLKGWHDGGEDGISGYQKVVEGLSNSWSVLMGIVEGAKAGFKSIFGELDSSGLIDASKAFADFTGKVKEYFGFTEEEVTKKEIIKNYFEPMEEWTHKISRGMKGDDVKKLQDQLLQLGYTEVKLDRFGADGIFGPETEAALKAFQKKVGLVQTGIYDKATRDALRNRLFPDQYYTEEIKESTETITHYGKGISKIKGIFEGISAVGKVGLGILKFGLQLFGRVYNILLPVVKGVFELASGLGRLISFVVDFTSSLSLGEKLLTVFDVALTPVTIALQTFGRFIHDVGNGISDIIITARKGVGSFEELGKKLRLDPKANANGIKLYNVIVKIKAAAEKAAPAFESLKSTFVNAFNAAKNWISGKVTAGFEAISTFFSNLWTTISQGDYLTKILNGIGTALQIVLGIVGGAAYGVYSLAKAVVEGGIALFDFVRNSEFVQDALKRTSTFFTPVKEFFTSVWESLTSISGKIGSLKSFGEIWQEFISALKNNPIGKKFAPALQKVYGFIDGIRKSISGFIDDVKKAFSVLKSVKDPEKAIEFLTKTRGDNKGAIKILDVIVKIGNAFKWISGVAGNAKNAVTGFVSKMIPGIKEFGNAIGDSIKQFFGGDGISPGEKLTSGFETVKSKLQTAFENLKRWASNLVSNSPFLNELVNFGTMVKDAITGFFTMDTSGIEGLPGKLMAKLKAFDPVIQWIKDKFAVVKDFLTDPNKLLSHVVGALKGIGEFVINIFKNVNLGTIWDTAKTTLGMYIMMTFAKSLKNFSKSFGVLTGAIDDDEKSGIAEKLRSIAVTIAIVTAAIAGLAFIPVDQAMAGVVVMTFALAAVVGALVAMNKWAPKIEGIGKGILDMALSIGAVIVAVAAAALLVNTGGDLTKPLLLVGGIMVALGVVAWAMSRFSKNKKAGSGGMAKTILAMCAGLYLVVKAVSKMTGLLKRYEKDADKIKSAFKYIAGMLVILGTVAVLMSALGKKTGGGDGATGIAPAILAMCTSLGSIVNAVARMAEIMQRYPDHFGWAYAMIEGILVTIGAVAVLLAAFSKDLDWKVSLASAAPIVAMGFFIDMIVKSMGEAIQKISGVDPKVIEQFLIGVGEALVGLVGVTAIFSQIGVSGLLQAAVGIVAIMGAIGLGVDLVATFAADGVEKLSSAMRLVGWRLSGFSDDISNVDSAKIETVLKTLTDSILPSFATMVAYASTVESALPVASNIRMIGVRLGLFQRAIEGITVDTGTVIKKLPEDIKATIDGINAIQGVDSAINVLDNLGGALSLYYGNLATAMAGETPADTNGNFDINKANEAFQHLADLTLDDETIKKIQSYATGGEHDLNSFAHGIENLGTSLKDYGDKISQIDPTKVETANGILDKAKEIDQYVNPMAETNFDVLNGKRESITKFGDDIAALGGALGSYSDSVANLNPLKITMANVVMDAVASLADKLPTTGGLWQMLAGEQSLGTFAVNMSDLGSGLAEYANKVSDANFTNVSESVGPITALARAQSTIQRNGGLASVLSGSAKLGQLGEGLVGLGDSLVQFAKAENGIKTLKDTDFTKIGKAIEPIKKLAEAQSILQNEGGWADFLTGSSNLGNLGEGLENFASHLNSFKGSVQDFDFDDAKFVSAMNLLERTVSLQEIVQKGDDEYDFANAGRNVSLLFSTIANEITTNTQITDSVKAAADSIKTVITANTIDQATTWGQDLATNLANGMRNNVEVVQKAAEYIADAISAYLHFSEPDVGPLSNMHEWMPDMLQNLASGITDNSPLVEQAVDMLAGKISDPLKNLFGLDDDVADPVITPVLDLSNVQAEAAQIPGMLNGQSVAASADMAKNVMSGNGVTIVQGGAAEDHSPEIIAAIQDLGNRIVTLETQMASHMSNLKVVMNTNALVGQIAPTMDRWLGTYANRN